MFQKQLFKDVPHLLLFALVFIYSLFYYSLSSDNEIPDNGQYYILTIAIFILGLSFIFWSEELLSAGMRYYKLTAAIFCLIIIQFAKWDLYGIHNEQFTFIIAALILFMYLLALTDHSRLDYLAMLLSAGFVMQSLICFWQLVVAEKDSDLFMILKGTFKNSGPYSCFLAAALPFAIYSVCSFFQSKRSHWIVHGLLLIVCVSIMVLTRSRTALIALAISQLYWVYIMKKEQAEFFLKRLFKRKGFSYLILPPLMGSMLLLFKAKELSAYGRLLKYSVLESQLADRFFYGVGLGRFCYYYPFWQCKFFNSNIDWSNKLVLSAGETYNAYNEYLEIYMETGVCGLVLLCSFFIWILTLKADQPLAVYAKMSVAAIAVSSLTTYALHCTAIVILLIAAAVMLILLQTKEKSFIMPTYNRGVRVFIHLSLLLLLGVYFTSVGSRSLAIYQWLNAIDEKSMYSSTQKRIVYEEVYPELKENGKFLLDYGNFLFDNQRCLEAISIYKQSQQFYTSYDTFAALANAYECIGDKFGAIAEYRFLSAYIPTKFFPKYKLAVLYLETGNFVSSKAMAETILKMPVKVNGPQVARIRNAAKKILTDGQ